MARHLPCGAVEAFVKLTSGTLLVSTVLMTMVLTVPAFAQRDRGADRNRERSAPSGQAVPRAREGARQPSAPPQVHTPQPAEPPRPQQARPNVAPDRRFNG